MSFKPSSLDEDNRTIEVIASTGHKGLRSASFGDYYEELSLDPKHVDISHLQSGRAKFLASHDMSSLDSVLGVVESATLNPDSITAKIRFSDDEISQRNLNKIKAGILTDLSIGYMVKEYTRTDNDDEIPTYRATNYQIIEISLVPQGFDPGAVVRSNEPLTLNDVEIITTRSTQAPQETEMLVKKEGEEETAPVVEAPAIDTEALKAEAAALAVTAERTRATEIRKAVRTAELQDTLAEDMIERGLSLSEATKNIEAFKRALEASKKIEEIKPNGRIEVSSENETKRREGFEQALLHRADSRNFQVTEEAKPFMGKSLIRAAELILPRHTMESDTQYAKRALSSGDLPLALANVAEKGLQKSYELQPRTFSQWTRSETLNNYKEYSQVKSSLMASLIERPENADAQEASMSEAKEVVQLKDHAIIHSFSSQMLANDDLGVISRLMQSAGVTVARLENRLAYSALTTNKTMSDSIALYHASHGNLGTAGAISETTVAEAYKKMRIQSSIGGLDKLNLTPRFFICGPDKEVEARKFFASIIPNQTSNVNIFQGSMTVIVDAEITGNQYYFAADPSQIDTVVCYRLAGQEQPKIESRVKFENSSLQLKVDHAFIAAPMDWRGLIKNAGN